MNDEQKRKLENEAKSWLQIQINDIGLARNCIIRPDQRFYLIIIIIRSQFKLNLIF